MAFREHTIPKPRQRPEWMSTSVVDPAWLKANPLVATADTPDPFQLLADVQDAALQTLFDPNLFKPQNNKALAEHAQELCEALSAFIERVLEESGIPSGDQRKLEQALGSATEDLLAKIQGLVRNTLDGAEQESLSHWDFARGIWHHHILDMGNGDITADEMLEAALPDLNDHDLSLYGLARVPALRNAH